MTAPELSLDEEAQCEADSIVSEATTVLEKWEGTEEKLEFINLLIGGPYSFKKSLNIKKRKESGYDYYKYDNFAYFLRKLDAYNHAIEMLICTAPTVRRIDTIIYYRGATFEHQFKTPSYTPKDQSEADMYMSALLDVMANFEGKYLARLGALYPATPEWFIY